MKRKLPAHAPVAEVGRVVADDLVLEFASPPGFAAWDELDIVIHFHPESEMVLPWAALTQVETLTEGRIRVTLARPEGTLTAVTPRIADPAGPPLPLDVGAGYALSDLFPLEEGKQVARGIVRSDQVQDHGTMTFIVDQVVAAEVHTPYAQGEALKKLGYSAIQIGTPEDIEGALRRIEDFMPRLSAFSHPRNKRNPVHAKVSFVYIRMLGHLMLGRYDAAIADMLEMYAYCDQVAAVPLMGSNLSRVTLTFGWLLAQSGQHDLADAAFAATVQIFRDAAANTSARRHRPFLELGTPLRSAGHAIHCRASQRGDQSRLLGLRGAHTIAASFNRLEGEAAQQRLAQHLIAASASMEHHLPAIQAAIVAQQARPAESDQDSDEDE